MADQLSQWCPLKLPLLLLKRVQWFVRRADQSDLDKLPPFESQFSGPDTRNRQYYLPPVSTCDELAKTYSLACPLPS